MTKTKYFLMFSGGKDSTAMLFKCLENSEKYPIDEIIFYDTGFEFPYMYDYLDLIDKKLEKYGLKITRLGEGKKTWNKWSKGCFTRGKLNGKMRGFPITIGMSWCTRELKICPFNKYIKTKHKKNNIIKYIGIASDEKKRIKKDKNIIYPLVDFNMTENDCLEYTKKIDVYNKLYDDFKRTGCYLCPKQNQKSLKVLINKYPELWDNVKIMEKFFIKNDSAFSLFAIKGTAYFEKKLKEYDL